MEPVQDASPAGAGLLAQNQALLRRDDVLLASYPRSGNDWLRLMLADVLLQQAGARFADPLEPPVHISRIVPGIYRNDLRQTYRFVPTVPPIGLRFLVVKTHEPFADLTDRAVCLVRQPADALMSHFRFQAAHGDPAAAAGPAAFCRAQAPAWAAFHRGYLALPPARVLFVTYEELRAAPAAQLGRLLGFLGLAAAPDMAAAVERQALRRRQDWERRQRAVDPRLRALPRLVGGGRIGAGEAALPADARAAVEALAPLYRAAAARAAP